MPIFTATSLTEIYLLGVAFVLCACIGVERQVRQKAAGFRTHVLVGTGSAGFTLVSAFGFESVLGADVSLDPSRIAAQIVSGIGFLGAGVIFTRKDVVRGLTTAATVWVAAAVGMAAGAGMVALALFLTGLHLLCLVVLAPLVRRIPTSDRGRVLRLTYVDGNGVLRRILAAATGAGFTASLMATRHTQVRGVECVQIDLRFAGRYPLSDLVTDMSGIDGVKAVRLCNGSDDLDDEFAWG